MQGEASLKKTIQSIARLDYDYQRQLLFIVADGTIIGQGNDRPTPRIVLDILGVDPNYTPPDLAFQSIGEGNQQLNYAKVYSGMYDFEFKTIPFIVVVKTGKPSEAERMGNRYGFIACSNSYSGKRDSQLLLMRFLSKVHYNEPMNPLELELYRHMRTIIGVDPSFYEFLFMVDADTTVSSKSLTHLVAAMSRDSQRAAVCGETQIANARESWITMIQVYEYFISHHLSKAFESLFGSVLCLPGCFSMYRLKTPLNKPVLIQKSILEDYGRNSVPTLHGKNLLELGEDRFLTTTVLRHCPNMRTSYIPEAKCETNVPSSFSVLISQRRRWINSTVHNFIELLRTDALCGFCCFSMRFVVLIDLFGTILQPSGLVYLGYLVYKLKTDEESSFPLISICLVAAIFGLQFVLLILKGELQLFGWMVVVCSSKQL